ncbi:MAG: universal stress protein [Thermoplasmata archaeon]|nr:MAG: universal stress protein [Thermoplasmata archaeon]
MKKILVGYDTSKHSDRALELAIELAKNSECDLITMFVRSKYDRSFITEASMPEEEVKVKMKDMMKDTVKKIIQEGVQVEGVILKGDVATKIIEYSLEHEIDLIVLGALGIGETEKYKLGSVAEKVVRYSNTPVLIAR